MSRSTTVNDVRHKPNKLLSNVKSRFFSWEKLAFFYCVPPVVVIE